MSLAPLKRRKAQAVRAFNGGVMSELHEQWVARVLNMTYNPKRGPDIYDETKIVEVKFCITTPDYPKAWTPQEHQMVYPTQHNKRGFWALGLYDLKREPAMLAYKSARVLERAVTVRKTFLVQWDWMLQYPPSETGGETQHSKWENTFRYPKYKDLPPVTRTYEVEGGLIHLTEGVDPALFDIQGKHLILEPS